MVPETCKLVIELVHEAVDAGARREKACQVLELPVRTLRRWEQRLRDERLEDQRKAAAAQRVPANQLTQEERTRILDVCNQPEYKSLPPTQIASLVDSGPLICIGGQGG